MGAATETATERLPRRTGGTRNHLAHHLTEDELRDLLRDGTPTDVADVLLALPEANRRALAPAVRSADTLTALIAGAACLPSADAIVSWLRSRRFEQTPSADTLTDLIRVLTAPGRPHLASVAAVLADRMRPRPAWPGEWPIAAAILQATGTPPPPKEAVVRAWVRGHAGDPDTLADRLAADPWLPHLLPHLFHTPGLDATWPPALARLSATGHVDRAQLIRLTLQRLRTGGSPAALRPAMTTHELLTPTPIEITKHRKEYAALLDGPHAALAQQALQTRPTRTRPAAKQPSPPEPESAPVQRPSARTQKPAPSRTEPKKLVSPRAETTAGARPAAKAQRPSRTKPTSPQAEIAPTPQLSPKTRKPGPGRAKTAPKIRRTTPGSAARPQPAEPSPKPAAEPQLAKPSPAKNQGHAGPQAAEPSPVKGQMPAAEPQTAEPSPVKGQEPASAPQPTGPSPAESQGPGPEYVEAKQPPTMAAGGPEADKPDSVLVEAVREDDAGASGPVRQPVAPLFPAAPVSQPADGMPPPIATVAELVAELAIRLPQPLETVSLERILAAVITLAQSDREELAAALVPLADSAPAPFDALLGSLVWPGRFADRPVPAAAPPAAMVPGRIREVARQLATVAPPALLATPATTDGLVSPVRVLFRLIAAERDGWQPGPYDLAQTLLRLPAAVDPTVQRAADRLHSPAGLQFATWLRASGLPPITATVTTTAANNDHSATAAGQPQTLPTANGRQAAKAGHSQTAPAAGVPSATAAGEAPAGVSVGSGRRLATFVAPQAPTLPHDAQPEPTPTGVPPRLHDPAPSATVDSIIRDLLAPPGLGGAPTPEMRCWPAVLPRHREVIAAHCVPHLADAHDGLDAAETLLGLAKAAGPFGPAMALALAHGLVSPDERLRKTAVEAVLHLAAGTGLDSGLLGRELRALLTATATATATDGAAASGTTGIVASGGINDGNTVWRAADSLRQIGVGRAWHVVWAVAYALVPALLRGRPVSGGVPEMLAVAAEAAEAVGARADLPDVVVAAAEPGRSELAVEAGRLARIIR
ncbi:hypothetical protein BJ973_002445 [Actinoplanes tereljensis]|uniref:Uncharacterized protein n=1 Tax=Paractinoplanes tereljensis TaxID=571912 RepID=A0A919NNI1_9ACTN|nr:hypothetical protein [Actinoplanes tereljensis]GIF22119.1 hypothetical protein Ate02nite_48490 [Actinoplanes tereljensis]